MSDTYGTILKQTNTLIALDDWTNELGWGRGINIDALPEIIALLERKTREARVMLDAHNAIRQS